MLLAALIGPAAVVILLKRRLNILLFAICGILIGVCFGTGHAADTTSLVIAASFAATSVALQLYLSVVHRLEDNFDRFPWKTTGIACPFTGEVDFRNTRELLVPSCPLLLAALRGILSAQAYHPRITAPAARATSTSWHGTHKSA